MYIYSKRVREEQRYRDRVVYIMNRKNTTRESENINTVTSSDGHAIHRYLSHYHRYSIDHI